MFATSTSRINASEVSCAQVGRIVAHLSDCATDQYRVPKNTKAAEGNELGIFESLGDHYSKDDLDAFWSNVFP